MNSEEPTEDDDVFESELRRLFGAPPVDPEALLRRTSGARLAPGTVIDGTFTVEEELGRGGMGVVYLAWHEALGRSVAIKVCRGPTDPRAKARLRREAQALAALAHPNIVVVHHIGTIDDQLYVVMEYVEGGTLRAWLHAETRGWPQILGVFIEAARGLAAAHAKGIVHRDFKPDNVLVGDDGRVRVADFGLATVTTPVSVSGPGSREHEGSSTLAGGTPRYMAPEQHAGRVVTAAADQFSFCVALWEALYGELPFDGASPEQFSTNVLEGRRRPPPRGPEVPSRVRRACERGLSAEPPQRWPSMDALLDELRKAVAPRSRRWLALGLTGGLAALGGSVALAQYARLKDRCTGAGAQLEGIWDQARREQVRAAILGTEVAHAEGTWARIEPRLHDYAQAWVSRHTEICEATRVREEQTEEAMDLRMGCLHERKRALDAAVGVLARADDGVVEKAVTLVESLPSMERCDDLERLQQRRQRVPPPEDPQVAEQVEALRQELAAIEAERKAGRYADAVRQAGPIVQRAEALGYEPVLAEALVQRGWAEEKSDMLVEAERDLEQAFSLAADHGHDAAAAEAAARLTWVVGGRQGRHEPGLGWGKTALALSRGPEVEATVEAEALNCIGNVLRAQGKLSEALSHHQRALATRERLLGKDHSSVAQTLSSIGIVLKEQGKLSEALIPLRRSLAIFERVLGRDHSLVAGVLVNIGNVLRAQGELSEALSHHQRALVIFERALGRDHSSVANTLGSIGNVLEEQGDPSAALTHYRRALAIFERAPGHDLSLVGITQVNIGAALEQQGDLSEALTHYQRALAVFEQVLGNEHPIVGNTLGNIGVVLEQQGRFSEALTHHQRALAIHEQALGPEHPSIGDSLVNIGNVLMDQRRLSEALTYYQRALAIYERALGEDHVSVADTLNNIGSVLSTQGELSESLTHYQRALAIKERALGPEHSSVTVTLGNIGNLLRKQGKLSEAESHYQRALATRERAQGKDHPDLAYVLVGLAEVALDERDFDAARAYAERAVAIREAGEVAPYLLGEARFSLARALWSDRAERRRAHALAQRARDALAEHGAGEEARLASVDDWLAGHRVP